MSGILFDALLPLLWPVVRPVPSDSVENVYIYSAIINENGLCIPVHITHRVPGSAFTPILPHGSNARVVGKAQLVDKTFFVEAQSIWADADDDTETQRAHVSWSPSEHYPDTSLPVLVFAGTVSGAVSNVGQTITVVDVTVARLKGWVDGPVTFRCSFNQNTAHLHDLRTLDVGTFVRLSGTLCGVDAGRLTVDVHDVRFMPNENPCTALSRSRYLSAPPAVAERLCEWLQYILDGASDNEECPPVAV